jgi:hypothetical protein
MTDLVPDEHDPGGKRRLRLPVGVTAGCEFSYCNRYRPLLWREWELFGGEHRSILWIGMNPSTASGFVDDPTVAREWRFSAAWGFSRYVKCNLSDYRATNPRSLVRFIDSGGDPWSAVNLYCIMNEAAKAERIIMAHGHPPRELHGVAYAVTTDLIQAGYGPKMFCLGFTDKGWPRHPLYVRNDTDLQEYTACPKPKT